MDVLCEERQDDNDDDNCAGNVDDDDDYDCDEPDDEHQYRDNRPMIPLAAVSSFITLQIPKTDTMSMSW